MGVTLCQSTPRDVEHATCRSFFLKWQLGALHGRVGALHWCLQTKKGSGGGTCPGRCTTRTGSGSRPHDTSARRTTTLSRGRLPLGGGETATAGPSTVPGATAATAALSGGGAATAVCPLRDIVGEDADMPARVGAASHHVVARAVGRWKMEGRCLVCVADPDLPPP